MSYALQHLVDQTRRRGAEVRPRIGAVAMLPLGAVSILLELAPLAQGVVGERWRIRSRGRCRFRFVSPDAHPISVSRRHRVLHAEHEPWDQLCFSRRPRSIPQCAGAIHRAHAAWSQGLLPLDEYVSRQSPLEALLAGGSGLLVLGPRSYVAAIRTALVPLEIELTVSEARPGRQGAEATALFLGASWFMAPDFSAEPIARQGA